MSGPFDSLIAGAIVGPTGVGKTEVALAIARQLRCIELVSADSMALYRGMDIGTAKPSREELGPVRLHLVDIADPTEEMTLACFLKHAADAFAAIESRQSRALVVGGSGLYVRAIIDGLRPSPTDPKVRERLYARAAREGVRALYEELSKIDPDYAAKTHFNNQRRIVRALEVYELTGRPLSAAGPGLQVYEEKPFAIVGIEMDRVPHRRRLEIRLKKQFEEGLLQEVRDILKNYGGLSRTARIAHGYGEALLVLGGKMSIEDAYEAAMKRIWNFVKRQLQWFRRDPRIVWVKREEEETAEELAERLIPLMFKP